MKIELSPLAPIWRLRIQQNTSWSLHSVALDESRRKLHLCLSPHSSSSTFSRNNRSSFPNFRSVIPESGKNPYLSLQVYEVRCIFLGSNPSLNSYLLVIIFKLFSSISYVEGLFHKMNTSGGSKRSHDSSSPEEGEERGVARGKTVFHNLYLSINCLYYLYFYC